MSDDKLTKFKKLYHENGRKRDELTRFVDKNPDHAKELWNEIKYFLNNPAAKQRDGIKARESLAVTADFIIGARRDSGNTGLGYLFDGKIANCLIYNRALSSAEILKNYEATVGRYT